MYVSMLEEAIAKAQNKEVEREVSIDPAIDLEVDAVYRRCVYQR